MEDHHTLLHDRPRLKNTCVRQVVLDNWFPLNLSNIIQNDACHHSPSPDNERRQHGKGDNRLDRDESALASSCDIISYHTLLGTTTLTILHVIVKCICQTIVCYSVLSCLVLSSIAPLRAKPSAIMLGVSQKTTFPGSILYYSIVFFYSVR